MQPFYASADGKITIYHGDCLDILAEIAQDLEGMATAFITDPPYASGARTEAAKPSSGAMVRGPRWNARPIENDQMTTAGFTWLIRHVAQLADEMLVDGGTFLSFIDWRQWPNLIGVFESVNFRINNMVTWDKLVMGLGNGFRSQSELIMDASKGVRTPAARDTGNVIKVKDTAGVELVGEELGSTIIDNPRDGNEWHPSPKPVDLMAKLIRVVTKPGDLIVDPFMGAGPTLVAAKQLGRRAIGIDIKREHCQKAVERLGQEVLFS